MKKLVNPWDKRINNLLHIFIPTSKTKKAGMYSGLLNIPAIKYMHCYQ
jgi:hypothetical protein